MKTSHRAIIIIFCCCVCFVCGVVFGFYYKESLIKIIPRGGLFV